MKQYKYSSELIKTEKLNKENAQVVRCCDDFILTILTHHVVLFRWLQQWKKVNRFCDCMIIEIFDITKLTSIYFPPTRSFALETLQNI